jgi:hypothetical protein
MLTEVAFFRFYFYSGRIQTLDLKTMSQVFYQCATAACPERCNLA